ncbi:AAA family ATPase [Leifsonia sp. NPDC058292]|uniref:AAA family ATPase n=1 Tax=Leifsonia sp. NPDC058292 TaxID=3346428 RepID=UPI0036DBF81F
MKLVVLRGNSGSGKSTVAAELRRRLGDGVALVEQDYLGRTVLGERQTDAGENTELIALVVRYALQRSPAVVLEGMLTASRYADVLQELSELPGVESWFYYFDIPFEETVARHATREKAGSFGRDELARWWTDRTTLAFAEEHTIDAASSVDETASRIIRDAGLRPGALISGPRGESL